MDAMLVSFIDHGATPPSTLAARNTATTGAAIRELPSPPASWDSAATTAATRSPAGAARRRDSTMARTGQSMGRGRRARRERSPADDIPPPGFGHRYHTIDPRATRLLQIAHELEVDHHYTQLLRALEHALSRQHGARRPAAADQHRRRHRRRLRRSRAAAGGRRRAADHLARAGLAAHALEEQHREPPMRVIDPASHSTTARANGGCRRGGNDLGNWGFALSWTFGWALGSNTYSNQ